MTMRIPYAMRAMIDEIGAVVNSAVLETKDPDGFGVWRTLVLDTKTTETFEALLDELLDPRIASRDVRDGRYVVNFVSDRRADDATPFHLDKAYAVLSEEGAVRIDQIEVVENQDDRDAEARRKELGRIKVDTLRSSYTLSNGTEFTEKDKKRDIIDAILTDEGF